MKNFTKPKPRDALDPLQRKHLVLALKMLRETGGDTALAKYCEHIRTTGPEVDLASDSELDVRAMGVPA